MEAYLYYRHPKNANIFQIQVLRSNIPWCYLKKKKKKKKGKAFRKAYVGVHPVFFFFFFTCLPCGE